MTFDPSVTYLKSQQPSQHWLFVTETANKDLNALPKP